MEEGLAALLRVGSKVVIGCRGGTELLGEGSTCKPLLEVSPLVNGSGDLLLFNSELARNKYHS